MLKTKILHTSFTTLILIFFIIFPKSIQAGKDVAPCYLRNEGSPKPDCYDSSGYRNSKGQQYNLGETSVLLRMWQHTEATGYATRLCLRIDNSEQSKCGWWGEWYRWDQATRINCKDVNDTNGNVVGQSCEEWGFDELGQSRLDLLSGIKATMINGGNFGFRDFGIDNLQPCQKYLAQSKIYTEDGNLYELNDSVEFTTKCPSLSNTPIPTLSPTSTPSPTPTPIPVSTIEGYKVKMPGNVNVSPVAGQTINLDPLSANIIGTTANPFVFANIVPGQHTVTATLPAVNYSVGYTLCNNAIDCHTSGIGSFTNYTMSASAVVDAPAGGKSDLWFHYWEYISWVRLKRASFHAKTTGTWFNYIPPAVVPYEGVNTPYDTTQVMLDIDELDLGTAKGAGLVTGEGVMELGPNSAKFSNSNFAKQNYQVSAEGYLDNLTQFVEYAKAKKDVKIVANMSNVEGNKINIIEATTLAISDNNIPAGTDPLFVIVQGNITINPSGTGIFNTNRRPVVLIATEKITLDPAVKEVAAILIAKEYDLGTSAVPLKIIGNLISKTPVVTTVRQRPVAEYQQASVYVVFHPLFYEAALPYLSTIIQEGRQLQ